MAAITTIDGSQGEGGGQILRSGLALSLLTGKPLRFEKIRAGRAKPGLMRQHLTAVKAAASVSGAEVIGDHVGSQTLDFRPGVVRGGAHTFAIGTAGSTTLVLQTVLLPLLSAAEPSTLVLEGGTHNPLAPTFEFLERAYVPVLRRMGANLTLRLERPGFFPAGGGKISVQIFPSRLMPLTLLARGEVRARRAEAFFSGLPFDIAQRELAALRTRLKWPAESFQPRQSHESLSPGNVVSVELECEHITEHFSVIGERGVRAEVVAERVAAQALDYLAADVPVGEYLADQLLMPLAIAGGGSFVTVPLSAHALSQITLLQQLLGVRVQGHDSGAARPRIELTR